VDQVAACRPWDAPPRPGWGGGPFVFMSAHTRQLLPGPPLFCVRRTMCRSTGPALYIFRQGLLPCWTLTHYPLLRSCPLSFQ